jgi:hypothetical protein
VASKDAQEVAERCDGRCVTADAGSVHLHWGLYPPACMLHPMSCHPLCSRSRLRRNDYGAPKSNRAPRSRTAPPAAEAAAAPPHGATPATRSTKGAHTCVVSRAIPVPAHTCVVCCSSDGKPCPCCGISPAGAHLACCTSACTCLGLCRCRLCVEQRYRGCGARVG